MEFIFKAIPPSAEGNDELAQPDANFTQQLSSGKIEWIEHLRKITPKMPTTTIKNGPNIHNKLIIFIFFLQNRRIVLNGNIPHQRKKMDWCPEGRKMPPRPHQNLLLAKRIQREH
jgi:hypothetical protein